MSTELYVGNLSKNTTEEELEDLFSEVGEVTEVTLMFNEDTGITKGFAYVIMKEFIAAKEAIQRFDGHTLDRHKLAVKRSIEHRETPLMGVAGGSLRNYRSGGRGRI